MHDNCTWYDTASQLADPIVTCTLILSVYLDPNLNITILGFYENPLVYCDGAGCNVAVHQGKLVVA